MSRQLAKILDLTLDFILKLLAFYYLLTGEHNTAALFFIATGVYSISMAMAYLYKPVQPRVGGKNRRPDYSEPTDFSNPNKVDRPLNNERE